MKHARFWLLAMSASGLAWMVPAHAADPPEQSRPEICGGHLTQLRGADLKKALTGHRIRFTGEFGVCPHAVWVVSYWWLELQSDGQFVEQNDPAQRRGRYVFEDDRVCLNLLSRRCADFYRDAGGRIYMGGWPSTGSEPSMIAN